MRRIALLLLLLAGCSTSDPEGKSPVCATDDDCCITDRSCDIILHAKSSPPPSSSGETCKCAHPAVQVACVAGTCTAAKLVPAGDGGSGSFRPDNWPGTHCGKLAVPAGWAVETKSASFGIEPSSPRTQYTKFGCSGP